VHASEGVHGRKCLVPRKAAGEIQARPQRRGDIHAVKSYDVALRQVTGSAGGTTSLDALVSTQNEDFERMAELEVLLAQHVDAPEPGRATVDDDRVAPENEPGTRGTQLDSVLHVPWNVDVRENASHTTGRDEVSQFPSRESGEPCLVGPEW
jgi:hypothetical protein